MDKAEIERIVEEAANEARGRKNKSVSFDRAKAKKALDTSFLILAAIGVVLYFAVSHIPGLVLIGIGMVIKMVELFIRFFL